MATILPSKSIYANDVNLIPRIGKLKSRKDVPDEKFKILISPMTSVVGETFVTEAAKLGLSVTLPRFIETIKKIKLATLFRRYQVNQNQLCFISIGLNENIDNLKQIIKNSSFSLDNWLIDISNGYIPNLIDSVERLRKIVGVNLQNLMVGNVVTSEGSDNLINKIKLYCCNNLYIRIGQGNGSACATSDNAGINRGQITELMECSETITYKKNKQNCFLISDGGIKNAGYALKMFGAGASHVLMGGYFVNAIEAETNVIGENIYFGCASEKQNKLAGLDKHSEGKERKVDKENLKPLSYLVKELWGGISSGISYSGYTSLSEFIGQGVFEIKQNSLPPKGRY